MRVPAGNIAAAQGIAEVAVPGQEKTGDVEVDPEPGIEGEAIPDQQSDDGGKRGQRDEVGRQCAPFRCRCQPRHSDLVRVRRSFEQSREMRSVYRQRT